VALADPTTNVFYVKSDSSPNIDAATAHPNVAYLTTKIHTQKTIPKHYDMSFMKNFPNLEKIYGTDTTFESFNFTCIDQKGDLIILQKVETLKQEDGLIDKIGSNCFKSLPNLQKLKLKNNKITTIAGDAFVGLPNLNKLEMAQNRISNLDIHVFSDLRMVNRIVLDDNPITSLNLNMFMDRENLEKVEFQKNQIKEIVAFGKCATVVWRSENMPEKRKYSTKTKLNLGPDSSIMWPADNSLLYIPAPKWTDVVAVHKKLIGLVAVHTLDLSNNGIPTINSEDLGHLPNLTSLWLHENQLRQLDYVGVIKKFPVLRNLTLANNTWDCNHLSKLIPFLDQRKIDYTTPTYNKSFAGINVDGVKCVLYETDNYTDNDSLKTAQSISIIVATCLSILLLCLYIVNVCVSSRNRKRIRFCVYVG
jgi:hypothetical protein